MCVVICRVLSLLLLLSYPVEKTRIFCASSAGKSVFFSIWSRCIVSLEFTTAVFCTVIMQIAEDYSNALFLIRLPGYSPSMCYKLAIQ